MGTINPHLKSKVGALHRKGLIRDPLPQWMISTPNRIQQQLEKDLY